MGIRILHKDKALPDAILSVNSGGLKAGAAVVLQKEIRLV